MEPTIGLIVHYKNNADMIYPAIVIAVKEDGTVDLQLFGHTIVLKYGVPQGEFQCHWMFMPPVEPEEEEETFEMGKPNGDGTFKAVVKKIK